jgi:hypothetical protein
MALTHINVVLCASVSPAQDGRLPVKSAPKVFDYTVDTLARRKALSESYAMHTIFVLKVLEMALSLQIL